jgi:hypothetical protein
VRGLLATECRHPACLNELCPDVPHRVVASLDGVDEAIDALGIVSTCTAEGQADEWDPE